MCLRPDPHILTDAGMLVERGEGIMGQVERFLQGLLALAWACTPTATPCAEGPLKGLPSKPGPHVEKIRKLGANEWLELGQPALDQK